MKSREKGRFGISRTLVVIAIVIASIGLGPRTAKYILQHSARTQQLKATTLSAEAMKPRTAQSSNGAQLAESLSDYQVVIENDLLKPLGWQKTVETLPLPEPVVQRQRQQEPPEPLNHLMLTGITYLAEEPMALIEDVSRGEAYFLKEGDKLKDYVVAAIGEENITLVNGNSRMTASLGRRTYYNADGELLATGPADEQVSGRRVRGSRMTESMMNDLSEESDSSKDDTADMSIIERMKARRRKELEQK